MDTRTALTRDTQVAESERADASRRYLRRGLSALLLAVIPFFATRQAAASARPLEARLGSAYAVIAAALAESQAPGIVVALTDKTQLLKVLVQGYADVKTKTPLTAAARFPLGSITKSFTAVALMEIWDEGRFDPQRPIATYLPELKVASAFPPITGRALLSHTAGLPNYRADLASSPMILSALQSFQPRAAPESHWAYSNLGYQILGYVLERIEGLPYRTILQRRVLGRLGMASAVATVDDAQRQKVPVSYLRTAAGATVEAPWFEYTAADGSVIATAADLSAFARLLLNQGVAPAGRVLSPAAFRALITPVAAHYAYGLFVKTTAQETLLGHSGSIMGFGSWLEIHLQSGFAVIVLTNGSLEAGLQKWIMKTFEAAYADAPLPVRPSFAPRAATPLAAYSGTYRDAAGHTLVLSAAPDGLTARLAGAATALHRESDDTFHTSSDAANAYPFIFAVEHSGNKVEITGVSHGVDWYARGSGAVRPAPAGAAALVGHYVNRSPEGPIARVFVRDGSLWLRMGGETPTDDALQPTSDGAYRLQSDPDGPERVVFGAIINQQAAVLEYSGAPLYRIDTQ